jgi:hypothetical protein
MIWKVVLGLARLAFDLALIWMLFGRAGKRGSAKVRSGGRVEFAPDWIGLGAYPLTIAYLIWLAGRGLIHGHGTLSDVIVPCAFGLIALSLLFSFPGAVVATGDGLEAVYWFRKNKHIRWDDIAAIEADKKRFMSSTITIIGADGTKIDHSSLLADRPRLLQEIRKHCAENLPPDFPREPADSL